MSEIHTVENLEKALSEAGAAHHEYEQEFLNGVHGWQWSGFYEAYVLGKHGNFISASSLTSLLEGVPVIAGQY